MYIIYIIYTIHTYITLHYIKLHYITVHDITWHYITYIKTNMHSLLWGQMLSKGLPPMWHHATSCDQHDEVVMYISSFQPEFQHPKKLSFCTVLKAEAWLSHCAQRLKNNRPRKASAQKVKNNRLGKEGAYHMELCQTLSCPTNDIYIYTIYHSHRYWQISNKNA